MKPLSIVIVAIILTAFGFWLGYITGKLVERNECAVLSGSEELDTVTITGHLQIGRDIVVVFSDEGEQYFLDGMLVDESVALAVFNELVEEEE